MSLIKRFSTQQKDIELNIKHQFSWDETNQRQGLLSDTSDNSMFSLMGYGNGFQDNNGLVKKYS